MGWLRNWRRRRTLARHRVDEARLWRAVLAQLPFLRGLSADESRRLRELAVLFLAEKQFSGAHGFVLDDAMRLSIAVQACLPILDSAWRVTTAGARSSSLSGRFSACHRGDRRPRRGARIQ